MPLLVPAFLLSAVACSEKRPDQVDAGWHIGLYMAADNNLDASASGDLKELSAAFSNGAAKVTVFIDRAPPGDYKPAAVPGIAASSDARILRLKADGDFEVLEELGEVDSTSLTQLQSFVSRIAGMPEEKKAIIFWNHGSPSSFGTDDTDHSFSAGLEKLHDAFLEDLDEPEGDHHHFDLIGFDTCLMGSLPSLTVFSGLADVYIASAELEPGAGWNYKDLLEEMNDPEASAARLGEIVVSTFASYYENNPDNTAGLQVTLAAWDTHLPGVKEAMLDLAAASAELEEDSAAGQLYADVSRALAKSTPYSADGSKPPRAVDLGDALTELSASTDLASVREASDALLLALQNARIAWGSGAGVSSALGLSTSASPNDRTVIDFITEAAGEEAVGLAHLQGQDTSAPVIELEWIKLDENPGLDFGIVEFSVTDDVLLNTARISLAQELPDGEHLLYASYRIDDATGLLELAAAEYAVPIAALTLNAEADSIEREDLGLLLLDRGQFSVAVSIESADQIESGRILLDEALQPVSLVIDGGETEGSAVLTWEEAVNYEIRVAPELGIVQDGADEVIRSTGDYRSLSEVVTGAADLSQETSLLVVASATDVAEVVSIESVPVP